MPGKSDKINVLFLMMQMEMGGSERLVHNLALNLNRDIFTPSIAWFNGERLLREFRDLGVQLFHIRKSKRIDFTAMKELGSIIRRHNIHVVNAHHFMPLVYSFYGAKIMNARKLFCTIHSEWEVADMPLKWRAMGNLLLSRTDGVIGVTREVTGTFQKIFSLSPERSFTIQNGANLKAFSCTRDRSELKKRLGFKRSDRVIGITANLKKIKNHIFLLEAFHELLKECRDAKLLLVGQGFSNDPESSEPEIRKFIKDKRLERSVLLLGYRSDIPDLLSIMDIFCLTSLKEGLPISLIEAMASGLPVVGTAADGIRDVIAPGRNGFLVKTGDVKGLKDALFTLLRDDHLRSRMGQESKALARCTYSLDQCIRQYQDLFLSAPKNNPPPLCCSNTGVPEKY